MGKKRGNGVKGKQRGENKVWGKIRGKGGEQRRGAKEGAKEGGAKEECKGWGQRIKDGDNRGAKRGVNERGKGR